MKKIFLITNLLLFYIFLRGQGTAENDKYLGWGNFDIEPTEALKMVNHFNNYYVNREPKNPIRALKQWGWVSSNVFRQMTKFLTDTTIDGYRVYFNAAAKDDSSSFPSDKHKRRVSFLIVPTMYDTKAQGDQSKHRDAWDRQITLGDTSQQTFNVLFNKDYKNDTASIKIYDSIYRRCKEQDSIPGLSKSVWISKWCITQIAEYMLRRNSDGLAILPAAYIGKTIYTSYDNQSTIILVTTLKRRKLDWKRIYKTPLAAPFNHGELCPSKCPTKPGS